MPYANFYLYLYTDIPLSLFLCVLYVLYILFMFSVLRLYQAHLHLYYIVFFCSPDERSVFPSPQNTLSVFSANQYIFLDSVIIWSGFFPLIHVLF